MPFLSFSSKNLNNTASLSKLEVVIVILQRLAHRLRKPVFFIESSELLWYLVT